jgi:hypothetical protein
MQRTEVDQQSLEPRGVRMAIAEKYAVPGRHWAFSYLTHQLLPVEVADVEDELRIVGD